MRTSVGTRGPDTAVRDRRTAMAESALGGPGPIDLASRGLAPRPRRRLRGTRLIAAADRTSNRAFLNVSGFLSPTALWLADADAGGPRLAKTLPAKFDASGEVVEQFEAASTDGTRIPYFVVHRKDIVLDG